MHVAVVDDQESSLAGFSQILRRIAEVEPICFKKASDALHWVGGVDPAFIVVNSTLADIPGVDFVRRLRLIEGRASTPVIFTSAKADRDLRRAAFELDVHAFLEKPINPSEFLVHAMHIVDARRERADMQARLQAAGSRASAPPSSGEGIDAAALIDAMLDVAVLHDPTIVVHHDLASQLATALGRELKLTPDELELLMQASRIYDIGKSDIPQRILESRSPATQADRITIERHAEAGTRVLAGRDDPVMRAATIVAQTHHERYDGSGYPRKLRGSAIPIMGRIVAVADTMSALLRARGDRAALSLAQAIETIEKGSGTLYDPAVVNAVRGNLNEISRVVHETQQRSAQAS
ncbi:MAG TPA: HD domain-containing phosphohydrolase [Candidatus Baltobacteraceae bacterium]|nr:HD domain-containing phosphohydrolase [Candidatus Baltobacteraceae bacterium]